MRWRWYHKVNDGDGAGGFLGDGFGSAYLEAGDCRGDGGDIEENFQRKLYSITKHEAENYIRSLCVPVAK